MPLRHLLRTRSATAGGLRATLGVAMRAWGAHGCGLRVEFHGKRSVLGGKSHPFRLYLDLYQAGGQSENSCGIGTPLMAV